MKCETCRELLAAYLKEELDGDRALAMGNHIAICAECAREAEGARKVLTTVSQASDPAVVQLVSDIMDDAVRSCASDIHIQPLSDHAEVRYRIDGVLNEARRLDHGLYQAVVASIRRMAGLPTTDAQALQDGRILVNANGLDLDLRVSIMPSILGESIVMRILDRRGFRYTLDEVGLVGELREQLMAMLTRPTGVVLVAGPTGAGKTTLLYAILHELNRRECHVMSVEDPVEYQTDGITQIRVSPRDGIDFGSAMRACLRQDPDIIMCGEIRDRTTADLVMQAAATGHMVLTTLHNLDAVGVLRRLTDGGVARFAIASALVGAVSPALARHICADCREEYVPSAVERAWLESAGVQVPEKLWRGRGCDECRHTGYRGRVPLYELFAMDDEIRAMLARGDDLGDIERAIAKRMKPMKTYAAEKVIAGEINADDTMRMLMFRPEY